MAAEADAATVPSSVGAEARAVDADTDTEEDAATTSAPFGRTPVAEAIDADRAPASAADAVAADPAAMAVGPDAMVRALVEFGGVDIALALRAGGMGGGRGEGRAGAGAA